MLSIPTTVVAISISVRGVQGTRENLARKRFFHARHLLRRALRDHAAAIVAAFGPEIDDPVGLLDYVEMVLDDQHGIAERDEAVEHVEKFFYVVEVQAGRGLVENIQRAAV